MPPMKQKPFPPNVKADAWGSPISVQPPSVSQAPPSGFAKYEISGGPTLPIGMGKQRPQSAVASLRRNPTAPNILGSPNLAHSADHVKFKLDDKSSEIERKASSPGVLQMTRSDSFTPGSFSSASFSASTGNLQSVEGKRVRPLSAMASTSKATASSAEKLEIDELKSEILEITKKVKASVSSGRGNDYLMDTESALKRFVATSDASQVHQMKSTLLAMVLQKHEEFQRCVLSEFEPDSEKLDPIDAKKAAIISANQSRTTVMLNLVDKAREFKSQLANQGKDHQGVAKDLASAKLEIKKLMEERDLLRATLSQASKDKGSVVKIIRPMTAPKQREPKPLPEKPIVEAKTVTICSGCDDMASTLKDLQGKIEDYQSKCENLTNQLISLQKERAGWQKEREELLARLSKQREDSSPPKKESVVIAVEKDTGTAEISALKKKLSEAEKLLEKRQQELKKAQDQATAEKERAEKEKEKADKEKEKADKEKLKAKTAEAKAAELSRELHSKDDKIKQLEKQLADANSRISSLEKKLNDLALNLKAKGENGDGALEREKELLKQVEKLTKEMTEARKEAEKNARERDRIKAELEKAKDEVDKLKASLAELTSESDALQLKLIAQVKELNHTVSGLQKEIEGKNRQLVSMQKELEILKQRIADLESQLADTKNSDSSAKLQEKLEELNRKLATAQTALSEYQEKYMTIVKEKAKMEDELRALKKYYEDELRALKKQHEDRERDWLSKAADRDKADGDAMEALRQRIAELEASQKQAEADRNELQLLRRRIVELEKALEDEKRKASASSSSQAEARVLRDEMAKLKERLAKAADEAKQSTEKAKNLEKKLHEVMKRMEVSEAKYLQVERDREETRAVENSFKMKMKALYDKRVKELEAMQQELEKQFAQNGGDAGKTSAPARPATAATGSRRR